MKYIVKEDVWEDLVTGQQYTREYAFRPLVGFNDNKEIIKGHVYKPYTSGSLEDMQDDVKNFGYPVFCFGQSLFLTEEQVKTRFKYLGKLEREENIAQSIKEYAQEECDFENLGWLAQHTLRDLTSKNAGGLSQCVQAKLLEFLLKNAESSEKLEEVKKKYFNNESKGN